MYPVVKIVYEGSDLCRIVQDIFSPNVITNIKSIKDFVVDESTLFQDVKIKYKSPCSLCSKAVHNRSFYLGKTISGSNIKYYLRKNGYCPKIPSSPIYETTTAGGVNENEDMENLLYTIACRVNSQGIVRKDISLGLIVWSKLYNKWVPATDKDVASIVITSTNLIDNSPAIIKSVKDSYARKSIVSNLIDMINPMEFPPCPDNFLMLKSGLFDIDNLKIIEHYKDYNITGTFNVKYGCSEIIRDLVKSDVDRAELETELALRTKELEDIIDKIFYIMPESKKSVSDRRRFEKAMAMLLCGVNDEIYHFCGDSDGGKSVIMNLIMNTFGDYAYKGCGNKILAGTSQSTSEAIADYKNRLVVVISELGKDFVIAEDKLKIITEYKVTADRKYVSQFTFQNRGRTIIDSNYPINVESSDASVMKRIQSFKFESHFTNRIEVDNPKVRQFVVNHEISTQVQKGDYNDAFFNILVKWYTLHVKGRNSTERRVRKDTSTLIHSIVLKEMRLIMQDKKLERPHEVYQLLAVHAIDVQFMEDHCKTIQTLRSNNNKLKSYLDMATVLFNYEAKIVGRTNKLN